MNCFEARQNFPALWKKELGAEARATMLAHLGQCSACDHAFRVFALSAPVLHSATEPARTGHRCREGASHGISARRGAGIYREAHRARPWIATYAASVLLMLGAAAAYLSVHEPVQTLSDAISQTQPAVELIGSDVGDTSDFAG